MNWFLSLFEGWSSWQWFIVIGLALAISDLGSCTSCVRDIRDELRRKS